jgi:hypothetical protein
VRGGPDGLRMNAQVIDADTVTDRQIAQPPRRVVVDSGVDVRSEAAVGCADTQRSIRGTGQLHRPIDDPMQCHIHIQIGADLDDDAHQLCHLIAS